MSREYRKCKNCGKSFYRKKDNTDYQWKIKKYCCYDCTCESARKTRATLIKEFKIWKEMQNVNSSTAANQ